MHLRSLVLVAIFSLPLLACSNSVSALCQKKLLDSHAFDDEKISIKLSNNRYLIYSDKKISHYLKYDTFLNLYLVEKKDSFKYPFLFTKAKTKNYILNTSKKILPGKIIYQQRGLNKLARYSKQMNTPALLSDNCCALEGIVTSRGIIQKEYLRHFIESKSSDYADFGFRINEKSKKVLINKVDYFIKHNPFREGDVVVKMDGKKVFSPSVFMRKVLFSKLGSKHIFTVKRGKKVFTVSQVATKRLSGGFVKETFLEHIGFYFDKKYRLIKNNVAYQLKKGDKLLFINSKKIECDDDIYRAFNPYVDNKFLIQRDDFSFIVKIKAFYHRKSRDSVSIFNHS